MSSTVNITEKDIKNLTPEHRIVWHEPPGQAVEMGLYVDEGGHLCTDMGHLVRYTNGAGTPFARTRIVRIIPPPFTPRRGMVIGKPGHPLRRLVRIRDVASAREWLGYAPELDGDRHWFTTVQARDLIESHGWRIMDDLTKEVPDELHH